LPGISMEETTIAERPDDIRRDRLF
jgi:hypothetical protein